MNDNAVLLFDRGAAIAGKPCSHRPLILGAAHQPPFFQCDVPSANSILLPTLYLPEGLFMGRRLISLRVLLS